MVQKELRDGQQRPHPGRVPAEARVQGLQAGQGAVQEGGVLPAEHVQHQHSLHQALRGRGDTGWARVEPGSPACPARPALTAFCRSESPFLRAPAEGRRSPDLCQCHNSERGVHCSGSSRRGRGAIREQRAAPGADETLGQMPGRAGDSFCPLPGSPGSTSGTQSPQGKRGCPTCPTGSLGCGPGTHAGCSAPPGADSTRRLSPAAAPAGAAGGRQWSRPTARTAWSPPAPTCRLEKTTRHSKGAQASPSGGVKVTGAGLKLSRRSRGAEVSPPASPAGLHRRSDRRGEGAQGSSPDTLMTPALRDHSGSRPRPGRASRCR